MNETTQSLADFPLGRFVALWQGAKGKVPTDFPGWNDRGIVLVGDFSGIQGFVFRPVPGVGGAARRLRARSFRVSAYTELVSRWCLDRLRAGDPSLLYTGGGRFLISLRANPGWQSAIDVLQKEIDYWGWRAFEGDLVFHLAAVPVDSGLIPWDRLFEALQLRRTQPLRTMLLTSTGWATDEFYRRAAGGEDRCAGCGMTRSVHLAEDDGKICDHCREDEEVGRKMVRARFARLARQGSLDLRFGEIGMQMCQEKSGAADVWLDMEGRVDDPDSWPLLRHVPVDGAEALDFDGIAGRATGARNLLGYLRVDVDRAGKAFADLRGDPLRTWALSRLLHLFFSSEANELLRSQFSNIYTVFGGGDDLFVIGPWHEVLEFAFSLRLKFRALTNDALTFSAGMSLAKPRDHILTKAREAGDELETAKEQPAYGRHCGRDQIRALGVTCAWDDFARLLNQAKQVTAWLESREIPSRFLHQALELHHHWAEGRRKFPERDAANSVRYHPLLYYQILRNIKPGPASQWAHSLLHPPCDWPWADFIFRYAMLASKQGQEET